MAQPDSAIASGASARSLQDGKAVPVIAVKETAPNLTSIAGDVLVLGDPLRARWLGAGEARRSARKC